SGGCLVRVRAQVMTRDDSTGGWVPLGGGGLSSVSVRKRCDMGPPPLPATGVGGGTPSTGGGTCCYQITGEREAGVLLSCGIGRDFTYNKVMPTFHHWRAGDHKFGLTFQTSADARAFDKAVRVAMEDLLDGTLTFAFCLVTCVGDLCGALHDSDIGDDEVFMTLELPVESRSSSGSSSAGSGLSPYSANHLHRINYVRKDASQVGLHGTGRGQLVEFVVDAKREQCLNRKFSLPPQGPNNKSSYIEDSALPGEPYSYVQFAKHEYSYPLVEALKSGGVRADPQAPPAPPPPAATPKKPSGLAPPLPSKARSGGGGAGGGNGSPKLRRCRHCLEDFSEDGNARGSCEYAPDSVLACINAASCISCAHCMLYHCMADAEGDFSQRPCSCSGSPRDCRRRWAGLALLSLLVPCLWCYLPLRACHKAAVACGLCGGRHQA
ncbi:unnamed protein product, partial [Ixodes hexagonus]